MPYTKSVCVQFSHEQNITGWTVVQAMC